MKEKIAKFFRGNQAPDERAVEAMRTELRKFEGMLRFTVEKHPDGWSAQCDQIEGIVTGGNNPNPSDSEIEKNIQEAIHVAFHIETKKKDAKQRKVLKEDEIEAVYKVAGQTRVTV